MPQQSTPYHFKNQIFLQKASLDFLTDLHIHFAAIATMAISKLFDEEALLSLKNTEQIPLSKVLREESFQDCCAFIRVPSWEHPCLWTINQTLACTIVRRLLGDDPYFCRYSQPLNALEIAILRQFLSVLATSLKETWKPYFSFNPSIEAIKTDLSLIKQLNQILKQVVITFQLTLGEAHGSITLILPCANLFPLRETFTSTRTTPPIQLKPENVELTLKVLLGSSNLSPRELIQLKEGDILKIDQRLNQPILLTVESIPALSGYPGLIGHHRGVILC